LAALAALAALGRTTQIGSFLYQSLGQGKKERWYRVTIWLTFLPTDFANVNK
jgi:hypothetical protein